MMITSVRIVSPIIETPSRMPDATATTAVTDDDGRQDRARRLRRSRKNVMPSSMPRLRDDRDEERQAEDEEHRVGVNRARPGRETTAGAARIQATIPGRQSRCASSDVGSPQNVATMTSEHPVGERVLVDLVPERSEDEQPEDGREHFRRQQPERQWRDAAGQRAVRRRRSRSRQKPPAGQHHDRG